MNKRLWTIMGMFGHRHDGVVIALVLIAFMSFVILLIMNLVGVLQHCDDHGNPADYTALLWWAIPFDILFIVTAGPLIYWVVGLFKYELWDDWMQDLKRIIERVDEEGP